MIEHVIVGLVLNLVIQLPNVTQIFFNCFTACVFCFALELLCTWIPNKIAIEVHNKGKSTVVCELFFQRKKRKCFTFAAENMTHKKQYFQLRLYESHISGMIYILFLFLEVLFMATMIAICIYKNDKVTKHKFPMSWVLDLVLSLFCVTFFCYFPHPIRNDILYRIGEFKIFLL